ncbi:uncharacterized protein [Euphorbia lathyris]|uniref:uncharacterized protein n=1 Tax=Euphorbia lathyris TaxID=212925 RepID=UPI0033131856
MNMEEVETKVANCELDCKEVVTKSGCDELEERSKNAEARVIELELEIEKRKKEYEDLEAKFRELEAQNKSIEVELKTFRTGNNEIKRHPNSVEGKNKVDLTGEGDRENVIDQLMAVNRVLECEKREAESEVVVWKDKFKELELWLSQIDAPKVRGARVKGENQPDVKSNMGELLVNEKSVEGSGVTSCVPCIGIDNLHLPASGTQYKDSPRSHTPLAGEGICSNFEGKYHREVRKHLSFDEERSLSKKIAPTTPGTSKPADFNVINIYDSDYESDIHVSTEHVILDGKKDEICLQDYEEDVNECRDKISSVITSKRKRVAKMVTSDTESDEDDNIPISKLKKMHNISGVENSDVNGCLESLPPKNGNARFGGSHSRRRLVTLRQCEEKVKKVSPTSNDVDGDSEEVGSESEGESLDGFIVNSSSSSSDPSSAHDVQSHSESESEGFHEILSKLERSKDKKCKWEFEADMLSAFGKDLELCMRGVCAVYRQQTADEQLSKESKHENSCGFSKFDALRGSELAEFLMDGDPEGDLKKSKEQLEEYGSSAVDLCRTLATRYSKQLFEIYKNKEDPLFLP